MLEEEIVIKASDGYGLSAIRRITSKKRKGIIQIHCGTGIPQLLYSNFAKFLTENGYDTLTFDYRGIGKSAPKSLKGFKASLSDWGNKDMTGILDWITANYPDDKKIIMAHSMGGQLIGLMKNNDMIDQVFLIASSTGYWLDMSFPYKLMLPPVWFLFIPLNASIFGYVNAKKIRQGENLPKGVALEWRDWCVNPNYFEDQFKKARTPLYFDQLNAPLTSIQVTDDPIANKVTANKILKYYTNSEISIRVISPEKLNVRKIGHTGFFSRKFKDPLWKNLLGTIIKNH